VNPSSDIGPCRACKASMRWVVMASGKRNPLNPTPDAHKGNILLPDDDEARALGVPVGRAVTLSTSEAARRRAMGESLYLSHFATCPNRGDFGKGGKRRGVRPGS